MPQIAQQDYLVVPIADITGLTDGEKAAVDGMVERGVILDCLILTAGCYCRILSYDPDTKVLFVSDPASDGVITPVIYYSE